MLYFHTVMQPIIRVSSYQYNVGTFIYYKLNYPFKLMINTTIRDSSYRYLEIQVKKERSKASDTYSLRVGN